jgi:hypothetical protein
MAKPTFCEESPSCSNEGRHPQSSIGGGGPSEVGSLMHECTTHLASTVYEFSSSTNSVRTANPVLKKTVNKHTQNKYILNK